MFSTNRAGGFTLIEMMIVVTIIALLSVLGIPSYNEWVQNTKVRNAAESALTGLEKAKAEAVKQNLNVEFVLGPPWKIHIPAGSPGYPVATYPTGFDVETSTMEGLIDKHGNIVIPATATPANTHIVTFSSLGGIVANADGSASLQKISFNSTVLTNARTLTVTIGKNGVGSNIRMCDPNLTNKQDPRAC